MSRPKLRLPQYYATTSMFALRIAEGVAEDDARGLLLLAAYRLAARLERLTEDDEPYWEFNYPAGRLRVLVTARVIDPDAEPVPDRVVVSARDQEFLNLARQARTEVGGIRSRLGRLDAFLAGLDDVTGGIDGEA